MEKLKNIAIVLAAGKSSRIGGKVKKQYTLINKKKLYQYSLDKFLENNNIDKVIVVLSEDNFSIESNYLLSLKTYDQKLIDKLMLITGGNERYDSVYNALVVINEFLDINSNCNILIHDSARMFIEANEIQKCIYAMRQYKAITLAKKCVDTMKIVNIKTQNKKKPAKLNNIYEVKGTINREELFAIQTPQCFKWDVIKKAYDKFYFDLSINKNLLITDDCMIVENYSKEKVYVLETNTYNEKITFKRELEEAQKNGY